jgi:hypothetical protein
MKTEDLSWLFVCECLYKLCSSAAFSPNGSTRKILQRCHVRELSSVSSIKIPFEAYFYRTGTACQNREFTDNTKSPLIFVSMSDLPLARLLAVVPKYGAISRKIFCSYITLVQYVGTGSFCFDSKSKFMFITIAIETQQSLYFNTHTHTKWDYVKINKSKLLKHHSNSLYIMVQLMHLFVIKH